MYTSGTKLSCPTFQYLNPLPDTKFHSSSVFYLSFLNGCLVDSFHTFCPVLEKGFEEVAYIYQAEDIDTQRAVVCGT